MIVSSFCRLRSWMELKILSQWFLPIKTTNIVNGLNPGVSVVRIVWSSGWGLFWKELLLVTDVSTTWAEVIFRVKWIVFVSRWCYKGGPLNVIGQFSHDGIGWKTRVKFVISHWYVSIRLLLVKLSVFWSLLSSRSVRSPFVGFVSVMDKPFVRRR